MRDISMRVTDVREVVVGLHQLRVGSWGLFRRKGCRLGLRQREGEVSTNSK